MSDVQNGVAVEKGAFLASELQRIVEVIRATSLATTQAADCVLHFHRAYTSPLEPPWTAEPKTPVAQLLAAFAARINADPRASTLQPQTRAPLTHIAREIAGNREYVLFGNVLADDQDALIGTICHAFEASAWLPERHRDLCLWMARNAEMMLKTFGTKLALELDMLSVSKRVARLQRLAQIDPLSGLENSASFEEKVREKLAVHQESAAFILLDIDHFKNINDLYGHQFGDTYLKCIAGAISNAFPTSSIIGRLGGDEFGILADMPVMGRSYLDSLLSHCRSAIQRSTALLGKPDLGRVSMGAAFFPEQADEYHSLYELADTALYASKNSGRSIATVFDKERHGRFNNRELGKRFRSAEAQRQIVPVFQPIVDLATGRCKGYEVLSRWHDPRRGILEPDEFSAVFTDHRLAEQLTRSIVRQSLEHFETRLAGAGAGEGEPEKLSFNLTSFDLMNREFVFDFQTTLQDHGFDWSSIIVEVTETVMLGERNGQVFRSLEELRTRGAKVALDDFGTGYGGLRHLKKWPVDILKVDRFFVATLDDDERDRAIIEAIVSIADTFGFTVVAEGIETAEQLRQLQQMQCHGGQGYVFDRPFGAPYLRDAPAVYDLAALSTAAV